MLENFSSLTSTENLLLVFMETGGGDVCHFKIVLTLSILSSYIYQIRIWVAFVISKITGPTECYKENEAHGYPSQLVNDVWGHRVKEMSQFLPTLNFAAWIRVL